jgi:feruloyl-CoA synthase
LDQLASNSTGSSTLIKRVIIADFELSLDKGEITDKGSINQRKILANHAELVDEIYADEKSERVIEIG